MNDTPTKYGAINWWSALLRRKVVQWTVAYAAGAWAGLQVLGFAADTYGWPGIVAELGVLGLVLGLPVVITLAFFHGERGQQRVTGSELAILTVLFLIGAGLLWSYAAKRAATPAEKVSDTATLAVKADNPPTLAVLPFADFSKVRDQEYLGDGLAEEILNQLALVPALRLVGRTSSFSFKGKNEDLRTIGEKLGVAHLLEGSVRSDGNQLRITAQLVRADDGTHLWSKTYARELRDVFAVQDEIARDVAHALSVKLDVMTLNRAQGGTTNIDAYDRYLRWRQLFLSDNWDMEYRHQQVQLAREALAFDPKFVLAWDALAISLRSLADATESVDGTGAEKLRTEATQAYDRIIQLAPDNWSVKRERAYTLWREGQRAEAIAIAREIMESGPLTYEHAFPYINLIFAAGHLDETVALVEQLRVIEPLAMFVSRDLQFDYIAARRYPEAEAEYRRSLALDGARSEPRFVAFMRMLAGKDADPKALRELHRQWLQDLEDRAPPFFRDLGTVLSDRDAMLAILHHAAADATYGGAPNLEAHLADALGEADLAAAALRQSMETRRGFGEGSMNYGSYFSLWILPYSGLRAHPEFKKLLIETGLADYWRQSGEWGDGCKPVGANDFQCQ